MSSSSLISVIIPAYNCELTLPATLDSILNQTHEMLEILIVDDCSVDGTAAVAKDYAAKDSRVRYIGLTENSGAAVARNTGIDNAKGEYIAFLDADDTWLPSKLSAHLLFMEENDIGFSYTPYVRVKNGEELSVTRPRASVSYSSLLFFNDVGASTVLIDRSVLGELRFPLIRKRQDLGLWLTILKERGVKAVCFPSALTRYKVDGGMSSNKADAAKWMYRLYRDVLKLSLPKRLIYFTVYAVRGIMVRLLERIS